MPYLMDLIGKIYMKSIKYNKKPPNKSGASSLII